MPDYNRPDREKPEEVIASRPARGGNVPKLHFTLPPNSEDLNRDVRRLKQLRQLRARAAGGAAPRAADPWPSYGSRDPFFDERPFAEDRT